MSKKLIVGASMAALLFYGAACGDSNGDESNGAEGSEGQSEQQSNPQGEQGGGQQGEQGNAMPEPDLKGVPDVVAEVNGEEIPKDEFVTAYEGRFQQMAMQAQQSGEDLNQDQLKEQTAEQLVNNEVLRQEANERGFDASQEQIDQELNELAQQNGMESPDQFLQAVMDQQGMEKEEIMSQVETQVQVGDLLADEAGDTEPTEQELRELYDQSKQQQQQMGGQGGEIPPFEEAKPQLKEQAQMQKESEAAESLSSSLREDAKVAIHL